VTESRVERRLKGVAAGSASAPPLVGLFELTGREVTFGVLAAVLFGEATGVGAVLIRRGVLTTGGVSDRVGRRPENAEAEDSDAERASWFVSGCKSWLRAWKSCDCRPLTGVTGSLGESLAVSSPSSRIEPLMSVGYCRGDDGRDDRLDNAPSEADLSMKRSKSTLVALLRNAKF
jgi:hypothetical protein